MKDLSMPITEKEISKLVNRTIKSPIRIASLNDIGLDQNNFLEAYSEFFKELPWDLYDPRRIQIQFLKEIFPKEADQIHQHFKNYFVGEIGLVAFESWLDRLSPTQRKDFDAIKPWRRRSIAQFLIDQIDEEPTLTRELVDQFEQSLDPNDFRSWPRIFEESPSHHVENEAFAQLMKAVAKIVKEVRPKAKGVRMTAHFMSVKATPKKPGDNSPEGAHEDGADFIISALVINRINVDGGASQVIEKTEAGNKEVIFQHQLAPGEFIFQGDSRDELIYGTDLWHHVTPFHLSDQAESEGWRDIIGFDINVIT